MSLTHDELQAELATPPAGPVEVPKERKRRRRGKRGAMRHRMAVIGVRVALVVLFIFLWEWASGAPGEPHAWVDPLYVSKPSKVWEALKLWNGQTLWRDVWATYEVTIIGYLIGVVFGVTAGFLLGTNRFFGEVMRPIIDSVNSIPKLALLPLFFLWFGFGTEARWALVATVVFFLVFYNTYSGIRDVDARQIDMIRLMGGKRRHIYLKVLLPSAMVWIIASLQFALPYALVTAITAEILAASTGVGAFLSRSSSTFYTEGLFAAIVVMVLMSVVLLFVMARVERYLLRWKEPA